MNIRVLKIVIASHGDVQAERDALERVVTELNRGVAEDRGLRLEAVRWETDAHPGFHFEGPQGLIDPILRIEDSDILIGIFWTRFGTPTKDAKSGTEHEIRKAYEAWKEKNRPQIMVYFNQKPYTPKSRKEIDQWGLVLDFREKFPKEGLWWDYEGPEAFEDLVRKHLTQHVRQQYELPSLASKKVSGSEAPLDYELLAKIERDQIIHDRAKRIEASQEESLEERSTGNYLVQKSRSVRREMGRLDPTSKLRVYDQIDALTLDPHPPDATRDLDMGILWLHVLETTYEIGYMVDDKQRRIQVFYLESVNLEPDDNTSSWKLKT